MLDVEEKIKKLKKKKIDLNIRYSELLKRVENLELSVKSLQLSVETLSSKVDDLEKQIKSLNLNEITTELMELLSLINTKIEEWKMLIKANKR